MAYNPGGYVNHVTGEVPSGTINGVNTSFTMAHTPLSGTLAIYVGVGGGLRLAASGFSFTGTSLTITAAPGIGALLMIDYRY